MLMTRLLGGGAAVVLDEWEQANKFLDIIMDRNPWFVSRMHDWPITDLFYDKIEDVDIKANIDKARGN